MPSTRHPHKQILTYNIKRLYMSEFIAVVQESRAGPFLARTLVGKSAGEITSRLLASGTAVAKVVEHRDLHPLARGKISIKDVAYFMEQIENTLFLGMEPRLALKACAITICQKSKSSKNLQQVVAAMERMVAGGESLANAGEAISQSFQSSGRRLCSKRVKDQEAWTKAFDRFVFWSARSENIRHQASMMILQPAITLLDGGADGGSHHRLHRTAVSIATGLPRRKASRGKPS